MLREAHRYVQAFLGLVASQWPALQQAALALVALALVAASEPEARENLLVLGWEMGLTNPLWVGPPEQERLGVKQEQPWVKFLGFELGLSFCLLGLKVSCPSALENLMVALAITFGISSQACGLDLQGPRPRC